MPPNIKNSICLFIFHNYEIFVINPNRPITFLQIRIKINF